MFDVVPFEGHATVKQIDGISSDNITVTKCVDEMVGMVFSYDFDTNIIDEQNEGDCTK